MKWWQREIRRRNHNVSGAAHMLTFSCYRGHGLLAAERTCQWLADAIESARSDLTFALWAFVFMPEHVHLLIHPRERIYDLGEIRQAIKEPVGRHAIAYVAKHAPWWLPKLTRKRGKRIERLFWQSGGGHDKCVEDAASLENSIDYIHMNPVRRKLVERPCDWRWSSAGWFEGRPSCPLIPDKIDVEWWDSEVGHDDHRG